MENSPGEHPPTLGMALSSALADLRREVRRTVRAGLPTLPLTPSQAEVLGLVRRRPGVNPSDVAVSLRLAPNTVSTIVGRLVEAGLVRRVADPDDARAVCLRLTPAGHRRVHAWRDRSSETVDAALERLAAEDRAALALALPALEHLVDAVAESAGALR